MKRVRPPKCRHSKADGKPQRREENRRQVDREKGAEIKEFKEVQGTYKLTNDVIEINSRMGWVKTG